MFVVLEYNREKKRIIETQNLSSAQTQNNPTHPSPTAHFISPLGPPRVNSPAPAAFPFPARTPPSSPAQPVTARSRSPVSRALPRPGSPRARPLRLTSMAHLSAPSPSSFLSPRACNAPPRSPAEIPGEPRTRPARRETRGSFNWHPRPSAPAIPPRSAAQTPAAASKLLRPEQSPAPPRPRRSAAPGPRPSRAEAPPRRLESHRSILPRL